VNGAPPQLSVLIASHNRRELLRRCLDSLRAQTAPPDCFEVIVIDDGSADGTAGMVEALDIPFALRVLRLEKCGKSAALNTALPEARGEACLFLDDDLICAPELVSEHLAAQGKDGGVLALGRIVQQPPSDHDAYADAAATRWNERFEELAETGVDWADCYGANFSAPRATLIDTGGFATELAAVEDLEIGYRLHRAGCAVRYLPQASVVHDDAKPGARVLADERRYGTICMQMVAIHPEMRPRLVGWFAEPTLREVTLRRLLLTLRVSPGALIGGARLIPGAGRRRVWFGFVSRYAFWRGVRDAVDRSEWLQTTRGVPVLMYHAFTDAGQGSRFVMPRRSFARQMRLLRLLRYRSIGFEELALALRENRPLPRRTVAITIDDGYRDNLDVALPVLRRWRRPATLFLVSGLIGESNRWHGEETEERVLLTLEQVQQMRAGGVAAGAHTRSHPRLSELDEAAVREEVSGSRGDLEAALDAPVPTFAYPYGLHDPRAVAAAAEAGFSGACTTFARLARRGDDPLLIPRIEIQGEDSIRRFLHKLWFGGV
jgi:glycosyltransferase involved in cell wall biosynthesis